MATSNLFSTIQDEIEARIAQLRPLLAEYEQLLAAMQALDADDSSPGNGVSARPAAQPGARRREPRGSTRSVPRRAAPTPAARRGRRAATAAPARQPRASRGAAREAILAALEHGSHTVGELATVTAMSAANIGGNVRKLIAEGAISKTERDGKAAYVLAAASQS